MGLFDQNGPVNDIDNQPALPNGVQPIPVHQIEQSQDNILRGYDKCPQTERRKKEYFASDEFKKLAEQHTPFIKEALKAAGFSEDKYTLANFYNLYDLVVVQKSHNLLNNKALQDMYDDIVKIGGISMVSNFNRKVLGNLGGGPVLQLILQYMENMVEADKSNAKLKPYKFIQYSGHDTSILSALAALNLLDDYKEELHVVPPYGSQLLFELHKDEHDQYSVQIVVRLGYEGGFKPYALKSLGGGCDVKCPFDKFSK